MTADMPLRWLHRTAAMADALGVDLRAALGSGAVSGRELTAMAARCDACTQDADCLSWISVQNGEAAGAPAYCRNRAELDGLKEAT